MVPRPVAAVLLLFPITDETEAARKQGEATKNMAPRGFDQLTQGFDRPVCNHKPCTPSSLPVDAAAQPASAQRAP